MQNFLHNAKKNIDNYREKPKDFTRKRKLPFLFLSKFLSILLKKSLQATLNDFFKEGATCTKSALCQARKKLKPLLFEDLFKESVIAFYKHHIQIKKFKKCRIWACDCSVQILPNNEDTQAMGVHKNQHKTVASIKLSAYFDVLNKILTSVKIYPKQKADLSCCLESQIKAIPKDVIASYDRGYGSHILPFFHDLYGSKYVIRLKTGFSATVKEFMESSELDLTITEPLSRKCCKRLAEFGIKKTKTDLITYRLVKIILPTGAIEILMTNLDKSFTMSDLSEIYRLRWGIETCFLFLKSHQILGTFSGYSQQVILQDIWINLLFYNMQNITNLEANLQAENISNKRKLNPSKRKKKENGGYQLNHNIGTGVLRDNWFALWENKGKDLENTLQNMQIYYLQSIEMIQLNNKERHQKRIRNNDRHLTELNYKMSF